MLIFHGVNVPTKSLPAYPEALGFGEDDAALLQSAGFNAVRLTVERYAVEPAPGHFDDAYIDHFAGTVAMLARHGIASLIDFHQDEYGPVFFDNGFPAWMTMTDGLPNLYQVGFPLQYLLNPALNRAFDHFWANDVGPSGHRLQADDVEILARVAKRLASQPRLLGFEVMNEPWPGTVWPTCFTPLVGCPLFDQGPYSAYHARAIAGLRAADPRHLIWYEPVVTFNYGIPTSMRPPADPQLGFAFHDYPICAGAACETADELVTANALDHGAATGNALLETEFGATFDTADIARQLNLYDRRMIPWLFWSYTRYVDALNPDGTLKPATGANVNAAMVATLARPFPKAVAGTPSAWGFDPSAKRFTLTYSTQRAAGHGSFGPGAITEIAVPAVQYPTGYRVSVTGATVASAPDAPVLELRAQLGAGRVSVTVTPA